MRRHFIRPQESEDLVRWHCGAAPFGNIAGGSHSPRGSPSRSGRNSQMLDSAGTLGPPKSRGGKNPLRAPIWVLVCVCADLLFSAKKLLIRAK